MAVDYILIPLLILIVLCLLGCLWECLKEDHDIDYSSNGDLATVFFQRVYRHDPFVVLGYTFEKTSNGKWKYLMDYSEVKKRVIRFVLLLAGFVFLYIYFDYRPFPSVLPIFKCILLSAIFSFTTLITYPLEGYIILKRDLRKKEKEISK